MSEQTNREEPLIKLFETTKDEDKDKGVRAYQMIIGGGIVALATSRQLTRPGVAQTAHDNPKDERYETVSVMAERPSAGTSKRSAHMTLEFTPPLASDIERKNVIGHLAIVTIATLENTPVAASITDLPAEVEPESTQE